jgi:uroporphyrinogen-III synthase
MPTTSREPNKLSVLLTRPIGKSEELALNLSELNITSYIQPLFDYQHSAQKNDIQQAVVDADIVIFVSVPAVNYTHACYPLTTLQNPDENTSDSKTAQVQFFAVGQATTLALQALGITKVQSPTSPLLETSEGLLALPALNKVKGRKVVIFRGNGGREHIANTLTERGATLNYIESYQRIWSTIPQEAVNHWKSNKINCIVATSNDILNALVTLIDDNKGQYDPFWREQCTWLVASQRIADNAKCLGIKKIINSQGASTKQLTDKLQQLQLGTI